MCFAGIDWNTNLRMDQNLVTQGDMPRFILDSYEDCHGPPQLFMLDKYGVSLWILSTLLYFSNILLCTNDTIFFGPSGLMLPVLEHV